jgi:hypothetical protein
MRHPSRLYLLAALFLTALQISCSDSSGPGHVATTLEANSETTITSPPSSPVTELPSVIVKDEEGNVMSGATVTFAVTSGGGTVTGGTQTTNSSGVATVGSWTLGSVPGPNTLTASVSGLPPLVFTASSIDPCTVAVAHTPGSTSHGTLGSGDCQISLRWYADFYRAALAGGTYLFDEASTTFDTHLFLLTEAGAPVGDNDDIVVGTNQNSRVKAILPAGSYILAAGSFEPFQSGFTGAYTVSSASTTAEITNCEDVFVMKGITTAQSLQETDCSAGGRSDEYYIFVAAGQTLAITMTSAALDSFLTLLNQVGSTLASNDNRGDGSSNAHIAYTQTTQSGAFLIIRAGSAVSGATGEYTLIIE